MADREPLDHTRPTKVIGLAGWSGAGKTTLLVRLIPLLTGRGLKVATLKHAHHAFDVDHPGKDSYEHRKAGASEIIVSSARRWAHIHEIGEGREATLPQLLRRFGPCDLILVEGFKSEQHAKLEVYRQATGKPPLHPGDPRILAVASDTEFPDARVPVVKLDDIAAIADIVLSHAEPLGMVIGLLETARNDGPA
jgi:molybdopterin-guanine dinucleotide biosynthesis adapter protein